MLYSHKRTSFKEDLLQNLTDFCRREGLYSIWQIYQSFRTPEIYLAENVADFRENANSLKYPWYKWFPFEDRQIHRAYITINNVGLQSFYGIGMQDERKDFLVYDSTGEEVMNWDTHRKVFLPINTFEEVHQTEGLTDNDWVFDVSFVYLINEDISLIYQVLKARSGRRRKKKSLLEQTMDFFDTAIPAFG